MSLYLSTFLCSAALLRARLVIPIENDLNRMYIRQYYKSEVHPYVVQLSLDHHQQLLVKRYPLPLPLPLRELHTDPHLALRLPTLLLHAHAHLKVLCLLLLLSHGHPSPHLFLLHLDLTDVALIPVEPVHGQP